MQGSYFHHLFLLCLWLLVKAPQLGCDAVSISGQDDRAAANQCWQKCSLAVNVSRSTAKAFESAETCYKECLKNVRSHQFAGNEQVRALSRRIKRDLNTNTNSVEQLEEDKCLEFLDTKSFLRRTHVKIYLVARGPKFYYANISWNISSDTKRNWTEGYLVLYTLQINPDTYADIHCHRVLGMNTSFTGFNIRNENLTRFSALSVMVFSLSQEREDPNDSDWKTIRFPEATPLPTVRTAIRFPEATPLPTVRTGSISGLIKTQGKLASQQKDTIIQDSSTSSSSFKFDAFIIYSTTDETWVKKKLLSILEKKHNIKCCIHYRDFLPGVPFVENMAKSVYNSRKTIAVVSKSFLSSNYCNHELNIALHRLVERADNSIIVIKLDDVEDSKLPIELQFRSYIDFTKATDKKTWEYKLVNSFIDERC
ncbi:PREDICTED: uncharacterized protein LOC107356138 [Acropora digitifera]|uniref:uncharacterized protein LOC107356138 n=1 Tax=Acropora digitifera TaxID=70779 RepID=UPI00077ABDDF|nr:PREDICTED: uncharacterized protein LOC107356138 [Acropora digitifera]